MNEKPVSPEAGISAIFTTVIALDLAALFFATLRNIHWIDNAKFGVGAAIIITVTAMPLAVLTYFHLDNKIDCPCTRERNPQ